MGIRIGTVFTGTVEQVGEESIQTKFFMVGVPLFPIESFFVLRDRGTGVDGFRIPLHGKSVLLAYLRWGAFIGCVVAGIVAMVTPSYRRGPSDFVGLVVMTVAWIGLTFFMGKPGKTDLVRRLLFKAATGTSAPPDLLPTDVAQEILEKLQKHPAPDNAAWRFVTASYQARLHPTDELRQAAQRAWSELSAPEGSGSRPGLLADDARNR